MHTPTDRRRSFMRPKYFAILVVLILGAFALGVPFRSAVSRGKVRSNSHAKNVTSKKASPLSHFSRSSILPLMSGESATLYASDCTTPRTSYIAGEIVCAKTDGVDLSTPGNYYMNWIDSQLNQTNGGTITQNPQFFLFVPTAGTWKAQIGRVSPADSAVIGNPPVFTVGAGTALATFAADCTTPKTSFSLGDEVCAQVSGAATSGYRIQFVDPAGFVRDSVDVTTGTQTRSFTLPTTPTPGLEGDVFVDNRGTWRVNLTETTEAEVTNSAFMTVHDPAGAVTDLEISKTYDASNAVAGGTLEAIVWAFNYGPDAAQNVTIADETPANTTFQSLTQTNGPTVNCTTPSPGSAGTSTCTLASLARGDVVGLVIVYQVSSSSGDTTTTSTATATSTTTDRTSTNNDSSADANVSNPNPPSCTVTCPDNITVGTNAVDAQNNPGAIVTFSAAETAGTCGTVSASPASGSFFPVGTTTVNTTVSGGPSCSFLVTVVNTAQPTITCPANKTQAAASGQTEASVDPGTPTYTGSNAQLTYERSDQQAVSDPYPIGTTTIHWVVTDQYGTIASCNQLITVTSADQPTISCPSNKSFTATNGCSYTATSGEIGTPNTTGPNVTVTSERSDGLALSDPFPRGVTYIEWTATNTVGSASCTQSITVIGNATTPPTLSVPPNVSVTTNSCGQIVGESELGTASASDDCGSVNVQRTGVPAGNFFPTGTTTITYSATNAAGTTTRTQTVTVTEDPAIPPQIDAPANLTLDTAPDATFCGTFVGDATLGTATASDNCPGVIVTRSGVPAGNNFPVGTTTITYTATDRSGNTAQDTQTVTVNDKTPPVLNAPANVSVNTGAGATTCSAVVSDAVLGTATATDNCPGIGSITRTGVPSGNVFPVGTTTVSYSVTDAHGNTSTANQTVTVVDTTPPVISCPSNIVLEPTCPTGAIATFADATATDNCGVQSVLRTVGPASGSVFPIGTTTVTFTATDIHTNTASCSFTVTVKTVAQTIQDMKTFINGLSNLSGTQKQGLNAKLDQALANYNGGQTNAACNKLNDFISQVTAYIGNGTLTSAQGNSLITSAQHLRNTIGCTNNPCT